LPGSQGRVGSRPDARRQEGRSSCCLKCEWEKGFPFGPSPKGGNHSGLVGSNLSASELDFSQMGILPFSINVTLDGCVDQEGIADDETHAFFTRLMDEAGAMMCGRVTYEMMESYWPAVARGDEEVPPAMREWAVKLKAKPKYVVSSTRKDFPWENSHLIAGDLRTAVQDLNYATPAGVLLGSGKLATELDRLDLIDEYKFLVHPRIVGHGPTLYQSGLPSTRRLELVLAKPLRSGAVAMHYLRAH
jgi:dihydrofolate reductase